jgi:hypothetical protein
MMTLFMMMISKSKWKLMSELGFGEVITDVPLEMDIESVQIRLPNSIVPSSYNLELQVDLEQFAFNGTVLIDFDVSIPGQRSGCEEL